MIQSNDEMSSSQNVETNQEVRISIEDIWIGNIMEEHQQNETDKITITLGIQEKQTEVLLNTGAVYNLLDGNTVKTVGLNTIKLPDNTFLRSVSGGRLPLSSKVLEPCTYGDKLKNLTIVCISIYFTINYFRKVTNISIFSSMKTKHFIEKELFCNDTKA